MCLPESFVTASVCLLGFIIHTYPSELEGCVSLSHVLPGHVLKFKATLLDASRFAHFLESTDTSFLNVLDRHCYIVRCFRSRHEFANRMFYKASLIGYAV